MIIHLIDRSGEKWAHVSCAWWIPEVSFGNPEKMEPIANINMIPVRTVLCAFDFPTS